MLPLQKPGTSSLRNLCFLCVSALTFLFALHASSNLSAGASEEGAPFQGQSQEEADRKSSGCISCHTSTDEPTMHPTRTVHIGCTDCHGGNSSNSIAASFAANSPEYNSAKEKAHVQPHDPVFKNRSALPERAYTKWLKESPDYVKFVNPGDLRVAAETCGAVGCHATETRAVSTSMMTHAGFLWGAALYNNGSYPATKESFPSSSRSCVGKLRNPAMCCGSSSEGGARKRRSAIRIARKNRASPTISLANEVSEPSCAQIPYSLACKKRDCSIRFFLSPGQTIIPATIAAAAAPRATQSTLTTLIRPTPVPIHSLAIPVSALPPIQRFQEMRRAIPSSMPSRARFRRASA